MTKLSVRKPVHIAVVAPSMPSELFDLLWKGVWNAAFELAPFGVRVDRYETNNHDLTAQKRILLNLVAKPPAVLAIAPAHASELNREIDLLTAMEVPVITFHTDAPASKRLCHIGADPAQSGAIAGQILGLAMGGKGTVASFPGPLETEHLKQRYLAFRAELKAQHPGIKEFVSHSGYSGLADAAGRVIAADAAGRVIAADPPISGIYVGCSRSYEVAEVLAQSGKKIPLVGFDFTERSQPYLANGVVSALIDENVYQQGYLALHYAYESIGGERCEPATQGYLPAMVMLRANCAPIEPVEQGSAGANHLIRCLMGRSQRYRDLLQAATSQIAVLSETDPLTGLLNRPKFEEQLSARVKDRVRLGILMVGVDGFERGKHNAGPPVSDEALRAVAKVLRTISGPEDDCARIASDEFCILMPGANPDKIAAAKEKILSALSKTVIAPQTLHLSIRVSAGGACVPEDASNAEDLLVRADTAMYTHKRALASAANSSRESRMPMARGTGDGLHIRPTRLPA